MSWCRPPPSRGAAAARTWGEVDTAATRNIIKHLIRLYVGIVNTMLYLVEKISDVVYLDGEITWYIRHHSSPQKWS